MTEPRNQPPQDVWHALRRLLACNRAQLATHLGVDRRTLNRWEAATANGTDPGENAAIRAAQLMQWTLARAHALDAALQSPPRLRRDTRHTEDKPK